MALARYYAPTKLSDNIHKTPEGYLLCVGVPIARTGPMDYLAGEVPVQPGPNGGVVIDRDAAVVFAPETIASFEGKPVTIGHPSDFVTPSNWQELTVGIMQNVRRGESDSLTDLIADLLITDELAIKMVLDGLREVSCGYEAEYEQIDIGRGKQLSILGNHIALVEQGRAGVAYAINDEKGKTKNMSKQIREKLQAFFAKTIDEATKIATETQDGVAGEGEKKKGDGSTAFDEMKAMMKDMSDKIAALSGGKEKSKDDSSNKDGSKVISGDESLEEVEAKVDEVESSEAGISLGDIVARLTKLEAAISKMMEAENAEAEVMTGDEEDDEGEMEETGDEESEEEKKDDKKAKTGDHASRFEILAPGMKLTSKKAALKYAYKTEDGKRAIDSILGGRKATLDSAQQVDLLFHAASEILKSDREDVLAATKRSKTILAHARDGREGPMTPEKMNELNAKHYNRK